MLRDLKHLAELHGLAAYERVTNVLLWPEEFTIDNGLLTPTGKLKRGVALKRFEPHIAALYGNAK